MFLLFSSLCQNAGNDRFLHSYDNSRVRADLNFELGVLNFGDSALKTVAHHNRIAFFKLIQHFIVFFHLLSLRKNDEKVKNTAISRKMGFRIKNSPLISAGVEHLEMSLK